MCDPPKAGDAAAGGVGRGLHLPGPLSRPPPASVPPHVRLQQAHACKNKTFLLSLLPAHSSKS